MAREQLRMGGEMISQFMPEMSTNEAQRLYAQSMGLNPDQAKTLVGGGRGGGGGGGRGGMSTMEQARAAIALNNAAVGNVSSGLSGDQLMASDDSRRAEWGWSGAATGAMWGSMFGIKGAVIGGVVGGIHQNAKALWNTIAGDAPPVFSSAQSKADFYQQKAANAYDSRMANARRKAGYRDLDEDVTANFLGKDLSGARLSFTAASQTGGSMGSFTTEGGLTINTYRSTAQERQVQQAQGIADFMGLQEVEAGPGTIESNGKYYRIADWQKAANQPMWARKLSGDDIDLARTAAYDVAGSKEAISRWGFSKTSAQLRSDAAAIGINPSEALGALEENRPERARSWRERFSQKKQAYYENWESLRTGTGDPAAAAAELTRDTQEFISLIRDPERKAAMQSAWEKGGGTHGMIRAFASGIVGRDLEALDSARVLTVGGGAALGKGIETLSSMEAGYLATTVGGRDSLSTTPQNRAVEGYLNEVYSNKGVGRASDLANRFLSTKGRNLLLQSGRDENIVQTALRTGVDPSKLGDLFTTAAMRDYPADVAEPGSGWLAGFGRRDVGGTSVQSNFVRAAEALQEGLGARDKGVYSEWLASEGYGGGGPSRDVKKTYYERLVQHPRYLKAKASAARGDAESAQQFMDQAQMFTKQELGRSAEGFDYNRIIVTDKTMHKTGAEEAVIEMRTKRSVITAFDKINRAFGGEDASKGVIAEQLSTVDAKMEKSILEKVSFMDHSKADAARGSIGSAKPGKRGSGTLQRAAGFGERESAMSSINRSIRHSERMHRKTSAALSTAAAEIKALKG